MSDYIANDGGQIYYHYDDDGKMIIERGLIEPGYTLVLGAVLGFVNTSLLVKWLKENVNKEIKNA